MAGAPSHLDLFDYKPQLAKFSGTLPPAELLKGYRAAFINPLSTGITFALTEKTTTDKIPIITMGYGRADSKNGAVFAYNFPLLGTYWSAADIAIQHVAKEIGGFDKLKGKKISLLYHDSPYGKEPIPMLQVLAKKHGFEFTPIPVTHPGVEQKSQWLAIRQNRPDYVLDRVDRLMPAERWAELQWRAETDAPAT